MNTNNQALDKGTRNCNISLVYQHSFKLDLLEKSIPCIDKQTLFNWKIPSVLDTEDLLWKCEFFLSRDHYGGARRRLKVPRQGFLLGEKMIIISRESGPKYSLEMSEKQAQSFSTSCKMSITGIMLRALLLAGKNSQYTNYFTGGDIDILHYSVI